jgi:hypothetical protein
MRLWALAALQASVALAWTAYGYFQPRLLAHFGFEALSGVLAWYLAFAGTTLAPLAGDASDRLVRGGGDRFPVVRAGVALAAASFVAVAVTAAAEGGSPVRFVLPLFVAVWIAGMLLFQAPALAIVRDVEGEDGRGVPPIAPLVAATALPSALWPLLEPRLAALGASVTFLAGGVAVVGTALALGRTAALPPRPDPPSRARMPLVVPFAAGVASAIVVLLATDVVPGALAASGAAASTLATVAGLACAVAAPAATRAGALVGAPAALLGGLGGGLVAWAVVPWCHGLGAAVAVAVAVGLAESLHLATALPFALAAEPRGRAGLVAGLYVAGAVLGSRLVHVLH